MATLRELEHRLGELHRETGELCRAIEAMRREAEKETVEISFDAIWKAAARVPIAGHPFANMSGSGQELYLAFLLSVAVLDADALTDSALLIGRIACGMGCTVPPEELHLRARRFGGAELDELLRYLNSEETRMMVVLECIMIASLFREKKEEGYRAAADLARLLQRSEEDLVFLSNLARVILSGDPAAYGCEIENPYPDLFDCYLREMLPSFTYYPLTKYFSEKELGQFCYLGSSPVLARVYEFTLNRILELRLASPEKCRYTIHYTVKNSDQHQRSFELHRMRYLHREMYWSTDNSRLLVMTGFTYNHPLIYGKARAQFEQKKAGMEKAREA